MDAQTIHEALSYDFVYNQARNGKPLHVFLKNSSGGIGHYVLVRGCYISNSVVYYRVMDPNVGFISSQMKSDGTFTIKSGGFEFKQSSYIKFN